MTVVILFRTVLESAVNYSKEWLARAENLQQLTMEEQKLFLKVERMRIRLCRCPLLLINQIYFNYRLGRR